MQFVKHLFLGGSFALERLKFLGWSSSIAQNQSMCGSFFCMDTSFSVIIAELGNFLYKSKIGRIKNDIVGRFSLLGDKNFRGPGARLLPIDLMVSIEHRVKLKPGRRVLLVSVDGRLVRSCCSPARSSLEASLLPVGQHDPKRPHRSRAENFFENLLHCLLRHPRVGFLIVPIMRNV